MTGSTTQLDISLAGDSVAGVEWNLNYPIADFIAANVTTGPVADSAGKAVSCHGSSGFLKCVVIGRNQNNMAAGVVARVSLTAATATAATPDTRVSNIGFNSPGSTSPSADPVEIATMGSSTVTILRAKPSTISPSTVSLGASQVQQFTTDAGSTALTWTISPALGTISASGQYTAPALISSATAVTVTAANSSDPTVFVTARVDLNPVTVSLSPLSVQLQAGQTQQFTATVTDTGNQAVTWSISPATGTISSSGLYTAPTSVSSQQTVTVTATSVTDPTKTATVTVTLLPPVTVAVSPTTASLYDGQTTQFAATIGGTTNTAVTWSLSPATGTISAGGLYTAPATVTSQQTVTVTATSVADTSKAATATVTLMPPVTVAVTPAAVSLNASQTTQFAATVGGTANTAVTWNVSPASGSITAGGLYTAPDTITSQQIVTVTATSVADPTKKASAAVTLMPPVTISVSPTTASLYGSQTTQFAATVGGTTNTAVTWSLSPATGTISAGGLYTAPATVTSQQTVTVTATSVADTGKKATATVTLMPPITVAVTPAAVSLYASQTTQFAATVGGTTNTAVTWSISPASGSITAGGLYTAPATISSPQTVTVTATSVADTSKKATATVSLMPPVTVAVTPAAVSRYASQTAQFTATVGGTTNTAVTWSISPASGSITAGGLYTAPATVSSQQIVTVTATSVADPTKKASAAVTLMPPVTISVSPSAASLFAGQSAQFAATVGGTTNTAVTWSISPASGSITAGGLYTAPAAVAAIQTVTVSATSVADPTKVARATVTLNPPVAISISGVSVSNVTASSARIQWTTNQPTSGRVEYGLTTAYGSTAVSASTGTTHSVDLTGLSASTTYQFRVVATHSTGSTATSANSSFQTVATTGLISRWSFNEGSGTQAADSAGSNHGTVTNGAVWTAGRVGQALQFDGVNDYVALPNLDVSGSNATFTAWVKFLAFPSDPGMRVLAKTDASGSTTYWSISQVRSGSRNRMRLALRTGSKTTSFTAGSGDLALNVWYHVAATYDGSYVRLYLNGTQVGSSKASGALATSSSAPVSIGRNADGTNYLNGTIDEVQIFNRAFTQAEVQQDMARTQ